MAHIAANENTSLLKLAVDLSVSVIKEKNPLVKIKRNLMGGLHIKTFKYHANHGNFIKKNYDNILKMIGKIEAHAESKLYLSKLVNKNFEKSFDLMGLRDYCILALARGRSIDDYLSDEHSSLNRLDLSENSPTREIGDGKNKITTNIVKNYPSQKINNLPTIINESSIGYDTNKPNDIPIIKLNSKSCCFVAWLTKPNGTKHALLYNDEGLLLSRDFKLSLLNYVNNYGYKVDGYSVITNKECRPSAKAIFKIKQLMEWSGDKEKNKVNFIHLDTQNKDVALKVNATARELRFGMPQMADAQADLIKTPNNKLPHAPATEIFIDAEVVDYNELPVADEVIINRDKEVERQKIPDTGPETDQIPTQFYHLNDFTPPKDQSAEDNEVVPVYEETGDEFSRINPVSYPSNRVRMFAERHITMEDSSDADSITENDNERNIPVEEEALLDLPAVPNDRPDIQGPAEAEERVPEPAL